MKNEIMQYILDQKGHVSFAELSNHIVGFDGDGEIYQESANIVFWSGISWDGYQALKELLDEDKILVHPCDSIVYFIDGLVPNLPVLKQARKYKKPHWLPVTINLPHQKGFKIIL